MEYRRLFDRIPEQFDRYRPRYCPELFDALTAYAGIGPGKAVLEIGPGTGQATDPILKTGCDYLAIELGEHLSAKMRQKYGAYANFSLVNDDFITHDFGKREFDVIYSATALQWIPERIAFPKTLALLRPGGTLAMIASVQDYRTPNEALYERIQAVYRAYFRPEAEYKDMKEPFDYLHAADYGYVDFEKRAFYGRRVLTAEEYAAFCGTHCDHLVIPEPYRSRFFEGLKNAVLEYGNRLEFRDTYILYLAKKPRAGEKA